MVDSSELRKKIVKMVVGAGEGHIPSSFSIVDIIDVLYRKVLKFDAANPEAADRDFFILSKGHGSAALYSVLSEHGFINDDELSRYGTKSGFLGGHPDTTRVPGAEASTGSLGHGLPIAVGVALGLKIREHENRVVVLVGDGECQEGTTWEAAHVATNRGLGNLVAVVDWNRSGSQLTPIDDLPAKWAAFGWNVTEIDGHNHEIIETALEKRPNSDSSGKPQAVVAHTIKGKGVSFLEGHGKWHHRIPNQSELRRILEELG